LNQVEQGRVEVVNILHQMQTATNQAKTALDKLRSLPGLLPDEFWTDLDKKHLEDAGTSMEHFWDFINSYTSTFTDSLSIVGLIHAVAGSDVIKDGIKNLTEEMEISKEKIVQLGDTLNATIIALGQATTKEISDLNLSIQKLTSDFTEAKDVYSKALNDYVKLVDRLSSGKKAAIPQGFAKAYKAVLVAAQQSKATRGKLVTKTLAQNKYKAYLQQLNPPGDLVADLSDSGTDMIKGDWVVYEKGGRQYAYRETPKSIQDLAKQLEPVDKVYAAAPDIDQYFTKWNNALSD
jgi:hypothetical protein